ncbi:neural cell adhesion molecule 1 isoform X1 [Leopardus geoffroyi]|uniref:Neural cell adhesion molecule 1 n=2 Tax=Felinae TaxID=338152 RepID=A0ABI7ZM59_FELCA|nr:neural cell adhesion molecule 1 isoform X12 [Felis catus]XP_026892328.1 neural cell adhesion molecule 1 isoform X7 [Acinonyx jubatus]XP_040338949.1 neural cell adhesion molecule 1 isoform X5 [Puma yagouaroundi]XP_045338777.1 neural cell adhesion molecule 1 isoform X1 [Leopardus geoffroyi]
MLQTKDLIWTLFFLGTAVSLQVDIVPSQGEISVGESKFFLCQVAGDAKDKDISWFSPNGEKLTPNQQRISVVWNDDSSSTLTIYNANIDDAGIYKCVVTGEDGSESEATVNVKIFQKLMFKNAPTPQEFREGEDAVIVCDVVSSLPPTIIWKHKGRDVILKKDVRFIVLSNNYLQIRGIKKTDEGTYRCEGRILARGEINFKDIQVIVNVPPTVQARQSIVNATANLGQSVTLICDAEGFPEPTMSWTKDGEQIENEEDDKYVFSDDSSELTIRKVDKNDEAEYVCIAENKAGEQDASIHLKVFAKPKITYVENQTAMELEEQVTLTCEASGDPIPSITWRTSTRNISSEEKTLDGHMVVRSHARVSSLTLKSIQYTDAGEYICTASNTIGQDSQSMYLEVQYAPKLQGPVAVYTWEGNQVNITCEVFAYPSATISWFRDGQLLPSSNYSNIKIYNTPSASYLEVTPDSENDFGNYNCTAVNRIGQESLEFILVQADTPSSPSIDQVEPYSSTAQVQFDEPEATGGVPILKYKAEWRAVGEEVWHFKWYDAKEANMEGIVTIVGLKPETTYAVRLAALNGKGLGEISTASEFKTQPVREPSAPKLEGQMGEDGNSIKVNLIKQDDGGSPIRHYLVKYRALSSEWKPEIRLPSGSDHVMLKSLDWNAEYEVYVVAENQQGKSKAAHFVFRTSAQPTAIPANGSPTSGLSTGAIVGILIVIFVLLLVVVDITCYFLNKCGLLMCIAVNLCGKAGPGAKGKDMEEGKAAFSKDESKEPIVEVRTEEERTPNHDGGKHTEPNETTPLTEPELPADTTATVEDMLPSVTTVTANSDTITETFATAQNSPTSETTTLTSSIAPPATATPDSNSVPTGQATPSKGPGATASSPPPASAPKVAPLVDLSDTPASAPAAGSLSSSVLAHQGAVLSPSAPASAGEASKAPPASKPSPTAAGATSPLAAAAAPATAAPQAKQEAPSTKGPDPEPTQPGAVKSPTEAAATGLTSPKSEAASVSATNPAQGEDFKMDEGNFKTPDIDLAKDVFAALGSPAPTAGASGQAPELAPSTADSSVSPAPAKTEKGPVEAKSESQETETKPAPAEVKTVPNDATQTKENESKA